MQPCRVKAARWAAEGWQSPYARFSGLSSWPIVGHCPLPDFRQQRVQRRDQVGGQMRVALNPSPQGGRRRPPDALAGLGAAAVLLTHHDRQRIVHGVRKVRPTHAPALQGAQCAIARAGGSGFAMIVSVLTV